MSHDQHDRGRRRGSKSRGAGGIDPRQFDASSSESGHRGRNARKTQQLCKQVERTLSLVLSGDFSDDCLQSLLVESVQPAPDASRLEVVVSVGLSDRPYEPIDVLRRLDSVSKQLRYEVASAITRRRAPQLVFRVRTPDSSGDPD